MGQRVGGDRSVLACKVVGEDQWCQQCGGEYVVRDTVIRLGSRTLRVVPHDRACERAPLPVPRVCSRVASQHERSDRSTREALACGGALCAEGCGRSSCDGGASPRPWACHGIATNTAVLGEGRRLLINAPTRFEGVRVIGVDEHVWRHTPDGDKYVTVILDVTPVRDRRGPSRLLDMVPGRSKQVFKTWLASQPDTWRERSEILAMDGFTGFKSAAAEELPGARAVMDPFHVVHLAGDALDECRRRTGQELHHRRGRATDPLYKARRMLAYQILPTHPTPATPHPRPVRQRLPPRT